jgi:predicted nucleic acid-binding protein
MEKTESAIQLVVSDAGPLIHLDELGCLDLLGDFSKVLVPREVWAEVEKHRPAALVFPGVVLQLSEVVESPTSELLELARLFSLHKGEVQALQLALQRPADLLLTDDAAARIAARQLELPVHGTIGIILRSIRRGLRTADQVVTIMRSIPSISTLHLKKSLLAEIIRGLGESD